MFVNGFLPFYLPFFLLAISRSLNHCCARLWGHWTVCARLMGLYLYMVTTIEACKWLDFRPCLDAMAGAHKLLFSSFVVWIVVVPLFLSQKKPAVQGRKWLPSLCSWFWTPVTDGHRTGGVAPGTARTAALCLKQAPRGLASVPYKSNYSFYENVRCSTARPVLQGERGLLRL